jgi:hypothetical protein
MSITYTGQHFNFIHPDGGHVTSKAIAHQLSLNCRWSGAVREFYSVAQHSCHVHDCVLEILAAESHPEDPFSLHLRLAALLHDASEFVTGDMATPLKRAPNLKGFRAIEDRIMDMIMTKFGLPPQSWKNRIIKHADERCLVAEAEDLHPYYHKIILPDVSRFPQLLICPWPPALAEREFTSRFKSCFGGCNGRKIDCDVRGGV